MSRDSPYLLSPHLTSPSDKIGFRYRVGNTPAQGALPEYEYAVASKYVEDRTGKHDEWVVEHMSSIEQMTQLMDMGDIGDVDNAWVECFAASQLRVPALIHMIRCLDPRREAVKAKVRLVKKLDLTLERSMAFRHTVDLHTWHIESYAKLLNWIAAKKEASFFVLPVLAHNRGKFRVNSNTKYTQSGYFKKQTLVNLIDTYDSLGVPMNPTGGEMNGAGIAKDKGHWNGIMITKEKEQGNLVNVHCFCSIGSYSGMVGFIKPWLQPQLPNKTLLFHHLECPIQDDPNSCGVRTMLVFQLCMFNGGPPTDGISYDESIVNKFRYKMLQRLIGHSPEWTSLLTSNQPGPNEAVANAMILSHPNKRRRTSLLTSSKRRTAQDVNNIMNLAGPVNHRIRSNVVKQQKKQIDDENAYQINVDAESQEEDSNGENASDAEADSLGSENLSDEDEEDSSYSDAPEVKDGDVDFGLDGRPKIQLKFKARKCLHCPICNKEIENCHELFDWSEYLVDKGRTQELRNRNARIRYHLKRHYKMEHPNTPFWNLYRKQERNGPLSTSPFAILHKVYQEVTEKLKFDENCLPNLMDRPEPGDVKLLFLLRFGAALAFIMSDTPTVFNLFKRRGAPLDEWLELRKNAADLVRVDMRAFLTAFDAQQQDGFKKLGYDQALNIVNVYFLFPNKRTSCIPYFCRATPRSGRSLAQTAVEAEETTGMSRRRKHDSTGINEDGGGRAAKLPTAKKKEMMATKTKRNNDSAGEKGQRNVPSKYDLAYNVSLRLDFFAQAIEKTIDSQSVKLQKKRQTEIARSLQELQDQQAIYQEMCDSGIADHNRMVQSFQVVKTLCSIARKADYGEDPSLIDCITIGIEFEKSVLQKLAIPPEIDLKLLPYHVTVALESIDSILDISISPQMDVHWRLFLSQTAAVFQLLRNKRPHSSQIDVSDIPNHCEIIQSLYRIAAKYETDTDLNDNIRIGSNFLSELL